jgi:hypothetical protein
MHTSTGMRRSAFEHVNALVHLGDEGYRGLGERVGLAEEGDDGGFPALGGRLLLRGGRVFVIVVVIVIVADEGACVQIEVDGDGEGFGGGGRT